MTVLYWMCCFTRIGDFRRKLSSDVEIAKRVSAAALLVANICLRDFATYIKHTKSFSKYAYCNSRSRSVFNILVKSVSDSER